MVAHSIERAFRRIHYLQTGLMNRTMYRSILFRVYLLILQACVASLMILG